mmetsp:Transcript_62245/g.167296  ORF Transcript_62245/g.167296 Transcript_62245/m.167296 type:complete len:422 (+) Transcript_62245:57-1322(+)
MKAVLALGLALSAGPWAAGAESTNPLAKVIVLIDGLNAKIVADGEEEAKLYHEYMEWCNDASQNANFAVESATKQQAKLEAKLGEYSSEIAVASTQIEELAAAISSTEADLKKATEIRDKESTDFGLAEKELMEGVDTMAHAISALEKEMAKNPAALAQVDTSNAAAALKAVSTVLEAAALSSSDHKKLAALLQAQHESEDEDGAPGAPAPDAYKSQSGGIVEILEDMKDKAESQLSDLRKAESTTKHNYNLMKQSLDSQKAADTKDMDDQKAAMAEAEDVLKEIRGPEAPVLQAQLPVAPPPAQSSQRHLAAPRHTMDVSGVAAWNKGRGPGQQVQQPQQYLPQQRTVAPAPAPPQPRQTLQVHQFQQNTMGVGLAQPVSRQAAGLGYGGLPQQPLAQDRLRLIHLEDNTRVRPSPLPRA